MTELETTSHARWTSYREALDAAGVEYDTEKVHRIEIIDEPPQTEPDDVSEDADGHEPMKHLPREGTKARELIEDVAQHPKEWVRHSDLDNRTYGSWSISTVSREYDVFDVRNDGRGHVAEYRLKELYRRELTGQAVDVDVLTEVRNA